MRAIAIHDFDSAPTLTDLPNPTPGPGEVLVRVRASSLNGYDAAVAAGMLKGMMEHRFPAVLGKDFAGTVEALGDGVSRFAIGDAVFGVVMKPYVGDGGFGEYVAVGEPYVSRMPDGLDLATAGALGLAGTAAVTAVEAIAPRPGQTVLISGATGGVGALALQYVVASGATAIATARSGPETELVRELGAEQIVDYAGDLADQVRAVAPNGVSAVLHFAGDGGQLADLLDSGGRLASTIGFGPDQHAAAITIMANPTSATLDRIAADAVVGRLRVPITRSHSLTDVPEALAEFAAGALGKIAITLP